MPDDDTLTAEVAFLRFRHRKTALPTGEPVCDSDRHAWPCHADRALRAVEAVLELHQPFRMFETAEKCGHPEDHPAHFLPDHGAVDTLLCEATPRGATCDTCDQDWPCDTYEAVRTGLAGEGVGDAG